MTDLFVGGFFVQKSLLNKAKQKYLKKHPERTRATNQEVFCETLQEYVG